MTEEIFKRDPYIFEFEAFVVSVNDDNVVLDSTAFYPGGGGQSCDIGRMNSFAVVNVFRKGSDIVHCVPENKFKEGDKVWCSVDWDRRYDLMKGHTAEHLLFSSLKRSCPELNIVKIFISPQSKYVIVDRDITWDDIENAMEFANNAIRDNLTISKSVMNKDDKELANIRADPDRIKGDDITVIEIGDVDAAACSGIHVMETEEIGAILVDRKVSAGKDGVAIHFRIGWDAILTAIRMSGRCSHVSEIIASKPDDVVKAAANMKELAVSSNNMLNSAVSKMIRGLKGSNIGGLDVFAGVFPAADRKVFTEASDDLRTESTVSVLVSEGGVSTVYIASGDERVKSDEVLNALIKRYGGRGGGKREFAQGMVDTKDTEEILNTAVSIVRGFVT